LAEVVSNLCFQHMRQILGRNTRRSRHTLSCSTPPLKLRSQKHVHYTSHSTARTKLARLGEMTSKSARRICSSVSSTTTDDGKGTQYALTTPSPQQAPGLSRAASVTMTKSPNSSPMTFGDKKEKIRPFLLGVGNARCQLSHMHNSIC
jgi:hypothetical protein